ncbi:Inner membrane protein YnbA [Symmachiella macrocystis]|uniref:Inner membrane protein YnbA n=1 Tax=Symmachiella macrocystis TaxID=2527985 RepID=A0A5C6B8B2_9PLAN|nr:CDP-alcohol phosphatidyltransferase family protein [Symmachiella macrocystis]TWU06774.1 Inner membrane protein YnbA [Symmachiella macrocystis]
MPSIYDLKPRFQALLRPITRGLAAAGVTANQVTVAAAVLSIAVGACIALYPERRWPLLLVPPFLFVRMALNAVDGMLAREHGMKSPLGAILNELGDVIADAALYLPFALVPGVHPVLVVLVVIEGIISEMTGVVAVQIGSERRYDGPLGKSDRAFLFGFIGLLLGCGVETGRWLDGLLVVAIVLLMLTIVNRARRGLAEVRAASSENVVNSPNSA